MLEYDINRSVAAKTSWESLAFIVTTLTPPNPENKNGDEDGNVLLRYVVV